MHSKVTEAKKLGDLIMQSVPACRDMGEVVGCEHSRGPVVLRFTVSTRSQECEY